MSLHSTLLATLLLGLGPFIAPPAATGQVPASDSAAPAASDSVQPSGAPPLPSDSVGQQTGDSAPTADTGRSSSDTIPQSGARSPAASDTATADTATAPTAPADSILSAACNGAAGGVTVARDLLVIVFAPEAGAGERAAAAESVDGRLLGLAPSGQPGAYYLQVPSGGEEHRLRTAADQLILLEMVRQVGARACPPPPLPDTTRQKSP